ncbi:MAG: Rdx family protein [Thermomicrobia bacterium]|nr:Rdx family protein [Thermomicrobia bacterium]MCA1725123.1 Rdx family protein [Thermomicrobia bacterium]
MARLDFVIRYDHAYEDQALALARRLFARFDEEIDSLALTPMDDGEFALFLNGHLIHSQRASGSAPRVADLLEAMSNEQ